LSINYWVGDSKYNCEQLKSLLPEVIAVSVVCIQTTFN